MSIPRFYCPIELVPNKVVQLPSSPAHHAIRVLRLKINDQIVLFSGNGGEYKARVESITKSDMLVTVEEWQNVERESPLRITLAQSLLSNDKMDYVLQKAVELGVTTVQPISTERTVIRLTDERARRRIEHWQQIVINACEQCGRNEIPQVHDVRTLSEFVNHNAPTETRSLMLSPYAANSLKNIDHLPRCIILLIGPEGGLTSLEEQIATNAGFVAVRLGQRILRGDTASLAALASLQTVAGDF